MKSNVYVLSLNVDRDKSFLIRLNDYGFGEIK